MSVAGTYDTVVKSPMGEQKGTFTVVPGDDGNTFTGSMAGGMGSMEGAGETHLPAPRRAGRCVPPGCRGRHAANFTFDFCRQD